MTYVVALIGGAHDGDEIVTEALPPGRIQRVHRAGGHVISTFYIDTEEVRDDGALLYRSEDL